MALAASGCSRQIGTLFGASAVNQLVPGQSTLDDATRLLGQPARTRAYAGGKALVRWAYISSGELPVVDIMFDDNAKMISIVSSTLTPSPPASRLAGTVR